MLADLLGIAVWLLAVPVSLALTWFSLEILFGLAPLRSAATAADPARAIALIPAHNEAASIKATIRTILAEKADWLTVLVVADNCEDDTANLARSVGATAIERSDFERRGKGFALAFGRDHIAALPSDQQPEVVIVVDADCTMLPTDMATLAHHVVRHQAPAQARNLLRSTAGDSPMQQISNFAMLVKNLVRARGLYRIGGGIPLFGTGMAFPWSLFRNAHLATDAIVEDMQLALDLARSDVRVHFVDNARIESDPAADKDMLAQRGRWEHGFIGTALGQAVPMLGNGLAAGSGHRIALGLHLMVPPLALLLTIGFVSVLATLAFGLLAGSFLPLILTSVTIALALTAVVCAWWSNGRAVLRPSAAIRAPGYIMAKLPLYVGFFKKRQTGWNRSRREGE